MRSSKSRSRSKSNRQRSPMGNIVNRVFDSSGPEGKVRGTPQQIIDKYLALARDAQLSNDRVAGENFLQHAEHYSRMLGEAQRELEAQRQNGGGGEHQRPYQIEGEGEQRREDRGDDRRDDRRGDRRDERREDDREDRRDRAPIGADVIEVEGDEGAGLVETPEMRREDRPADGDRRDDGGRSRRQRRPRRGAPDAEAVPEGPDETPSEAAE